MSKNVNRQRKNHYLEVASLGVLLMANPLFAQTVRYAYDKDGRLTQVTHGDGVADTYQYDVANNLIKNTGVPDNATTTFSLTEYTPKSGIAGTVITITGTAFSNPTVSFNGIPATVSTNTDTSLTVAVPTGATSGPLTVTVGGQTLTAGAFNVLVDPNAFSVADFTPKSAAIGNSLTITGTGFTNPTVTINGVSAPVTTSTATSLTVMVPTGVSSGPIVVTVNGQTQTAGTFAVATPVPSFTVTDFMPKSALVGSSVTITGTGFSNPSVAFNGIPATVTNGTPTSITATVPAGAVTGPLTVTVGGQSKTAGNFTAITVTVAPMLTTYSLPIAQPGSTITLSGSNFDTSSPAANTVTVGGIEAQVTAVTANQITFVVPLMAVDANPLGTSGTPKTVTVQTAGGETSAPQPLYLVPRIVFTQPANQSITGTFNAYGDNGLILLPQGGSYNFSVEGSNVNGSGTMDVFIFGPDNTLVQSFVVPSQGFSLQVGGSFQGSTPLTLPTGGPYVMQTVFGYELSRGFQATGTVNFRLVDFPSLTSFAPQAGFEGDSVTITGRGFINPFVQFGGIGGLGTFGSTPATVTASTSTSITVTVPVGAVSSPLFVQIRSDYNSENNLQFSDKFVVIPWSIRSVSPKAGTQGDSITISGTGFNNPLVTFDGVGAQVLTSSPGSITVKVPNSLTVGTNTLEVINRGSTKIAGPFTFGASHAITGYTPQLGMAGDSLTITGSGFSNPTAAFNGVLATVTNKTATSITVTVPSGATTGPLTVTEGGVSLTAGDFTVSFATSILLMAVMEPILLLVYCRPAMVISMARTIEEEQRTKAIFSE
jgi:large repetitive protein